jgi:isopentenyldiphosphate isomerase
LKGYRISWHDKATGRANVKKLHFEEGHDIHDSFRSFSWFCFAVCY